MRCSRAATRREARRRASPSRCHSCGTRASSRRPPNSELSTGPDDGGVAPRRTGSPGLGGSRADDRLIPPASPRRGAMSATGVTAAVTPRGDTALRMVLSHSVGRT
jgi:hypothetical protein